ncbi:hypothetical protein Tco_1390750, partial [Tanacetum coccineum]
MAEETLFTAPVEILEEGPSEPDLKEPPVGMNALYTTNKNHLPNHTPKNTSENASGDLVMQFVVQNFDQINAMYIAFSTKRKELHPTSIPTNDDHPLLNHGSQTLKFMFKETEWSVRSLVASPFTARIRDYDMPDRLKVPTNLKTYDGTTDPDDHLTIFMGTMDAEILDRMMTGAFISGLRPGRFFKDLIARPPASMEDLFTQAHNFIRADEANAETRLRDSRE